METFSLSTSESEAYEKIARILKEIPVSSQYTVLRNLAHAMNRKVVKAGKAEFRAAMLAARASQPSMRAKDVLTSSKKKSKKKKGASEDPFYNSPEGKALLTKRNTLKKELSEHPAPDSESAAPIRDGISALSKQLREGSRIFRSSGPHGGDAASEEAKSQTA
jgi:anaerobic ribonucleoside-triphosphate reductase